MSLGKWFVFGYEGFPREDRRRFYSQRDDGNDSGGDDETRYDGGARCYRRRRRLRKVRRSLSSSESPLLASSTSTNVEEDKDAHYDPSHDDRGDKDDDRMQDNTDAYCWVETSASDSNGEDDDAWDFGDENDTHDDLDGTPHGAAAIGSSFSCNRSTIERTHELPIRCSQLQLSSLPPLYGSSMAVLEGRRSVAIPPPSLDDVATPEERETMSVASCVFVHGGVDIHPSGSHLPQSASHAHRVPLSYSQRCSPSLSFTKVDAHTHMTSRRGSRSRTTDWSDPFDVVPSLKRWRHVHQPPERFGHVMAALPTNCIEMSSQSIVNEWNTILTTSPMGDADTTGQGGTRSVVNTLEVYAVFVFGGSTQFQSIGAPPSSMAGCVLSEPMLGLIIHATTVCASSAEDTVPSDAGWHCSWQPVEFMNGDDVVSAEESGVGSSRLLCPRVFFTMNPWNGGEKPARRGATFLLYGGTEDGLIPSVPCSVPMLLSVDLHERALDVVVLKTVGIPPDPRFGHSTTWVHGSQSYVVHGGIGAGGSPLSDVYTLDVTCCVWREIIVPMVGSASCRSSMLQPRAFHVGIELHQQHSVLFFGGEGGGGGGGDGDERGCFLPCVEYFPGSNEWKRVTFPLLRSTLPRRNNAGHFSSRERTPTTPLFVSPPQPGTPTRPTLSASLDSTSPMTPLMKRSLSSALPISNSDTALQDILNALYKKKHVLRKEDVPHEEDLSNNNNNNSARREVDSDYASLCHGSSPAVVTLPGLGTWIVGGSQSGFLRGSCATWLPQTASSLCEFAAMWLLQHNEAASDVVCGSMRGGGRSTLEGDSEGDVDLEIHARRQYAESKVRSMRLN